MTEETLTKEPYIGPRPFERDDQSIFFGRDHEAKELVSLIIAHPAVLLYAPSGAGKTSLLQAQAIPLLEERDVEVLGPARVGGETHLEGPREAVKNVFVFNALMSIQPDYAAAGHLSRQTFAEFLAARRYPESKEDGLLSIRLLLFDQFEEIFTSNPERWTNRGGFFEEIGAALEEDDRLRVVFAMREEYIASLDPYMDQLPERLRTRYRLEPLREEAALKAVKGPLAGFHRTFAEGAAEALVDTLLHRAVKTLDGMAVASAEFVDPLQLQVVCRRLWRSLPEPAMEIEPAHILGYADLDKALEEYYDECIQAVLADIEEQVIREWFEQKLVTSEKTRSLVFRGRYETAGLPNRVIDQLERLHLVHVEVRGGQRWYELIHDRLIEPIETSNRKWRQEMRLGDSDVEQLIQDRAHLRSSARKLNREVGKPTRAFFKYLERSDSTPEEVLDDYFHAELIFALEVLEGSIHLRRLGPKSYARLEQQWLSDVKRTKAYLLWEEQEGSSEHGHPDDYYFGACRRLRGGLLEEGLKTSVQGFSALEEYLKSCYLDSAGRFDPGKPDADALLRRKAHRIYTVGSGAGADTDWSHAYDYARLYYNNIISAVKKQDEASTLAVLKAFQLSRAPENRYLIINCFEAALAIYFLAADVIRAIWEQAEEQHVPGF